MNKARMMSFNILVSKFEVWLELHQYNGLVLIILALSHLALNWSWGRANFFRKIAKG